MAPWQTVLGYQSGNDLSSLRKKYMKLALKHHPNKGGTTAAFQALSSAWNDAQKVHAHPAGCAYV